MLGKRPSLTELRLAKEIHFLSWFWIRLLRTSLFLKNESEKKVIVLDIRMCSWVLHIEGHSRNLHKLGKILHKHDHMWMFYFHLWFGHTPTYHYCSPYYRCIHVFHLATWLNHNRDYSNRMFHIDLSTSTFHKCT